MNRTLITYLNEFEKRGNRPCLYYRTPLRRFTTTYHDLFADAHRLAAYFETCGFKPKDRILLWGNNSPAWVKTFLACLLKQIIVVPMDIRGNAAFVKKIYEFTEAAAVVCDEFKRSELDGLRVIGFDELRKNVKSIEFRRMNTDDIEPSDAAEILFTSGTTGHPKGVVLTHENIVTNVEDLYSCMRGFSPSENWLSILPLSHIFEQTIGLWVPLKLSASISYLQTLKASSIVKSFREDKITIAPVVPRILKLIQGNILREAERLHKEALIKKLLRLAGHLPMGVRRYLFPPIKRKFGTLRYFVVGGASLETNLERFWELLGFPILQGYGLSETSPVISSNFPQRRRFGSIGKIVPHVKVKIGPDGEILAQGPSVFSGYYKDPKMTEDVFEDGWFKTGDVGQFDQDGFLFFKGRKKEVIVTAEGMNVYPQDLEMQLNHVKGIKESCVVGIEREGKSLIHASLLLENPDMNAKDIIEKINAGLADYQKIQSFNVWPLDDFPRTSTMKIKKNEVIKILQGVVSMVGKSAASKKDIPKIYLLVADLARMAPETLNGQHRLGIDLGLSSLDRLELASMIEEEFGILIDDDTLTNETSLGQIEEMIQNRKWSAKEKESIRWPAYKWVSPIRTFLQNFVSFPFVGLFCRLKTSGTENLEGLKGPVIFVCNHQSFFDGPILMESFPPHIRKHVAIAAWREFFEPEKVPIWMWLWKRIAFYYAAVTCNIYMFAQKKGFKKSFEHTGWLIDHGFHVLIFPEGARTHTGELLEFQAGIDIIIANMKVPVVPVAIKGLNEIYPRGKAFPVKRGDVLCRFGKPILFDDDVQTGIRQTLKTEIQKLLL